MGRSSIDTQDVVSEHLFAAAARRNSQGNINPFTVAGIAKATRLDEDEVEKALQDLDKADEIRRAQVYVDIHLPDDKNGERVLRSLARNGYLAYSPFYAVALGILALYLVFSTFGTPAPTTPVTTVEGAYREGFLSAIALTLVFGTIAGWVIHRAISWFYQWKLTSVQTFDLIARTTMPSLALSGLLVVVYYGLSLRGTFQFDQTVVLGLIGLSFTISIGMAHLMEREES